MTVAWMKLLAHVLGLVGVLLTLRAGLAFLHGRASRPGPDVIVRTRPVFTPGLVDDD
jgi:hypothetical protein